ncbi:glucose dehydrogenase [Pseudonocardia dioxanivorans CB1190]|uniref:Glucose dehydrogenase n=1 Tax=Pseudonocardia dioxanivorans (strain ATCC 55486 / DSM 44775 / JCM 13855 / CB1190) TaxID=675635 RepID=F4CPD2_PSEUX|nr:PQQ-dependent sugar dehydrogenase [Pseudonocardia dioxanivorans]AEA24047.1 glucose dehydrogenase [Pseudonocardia dioxanivorans CB1190]
MARWRIVGGMVAVCLFLVGGCASFPDDGSRTWHDQVESSGELGGPPTLDEPEPPADPSSGNAPPPTSSAPQQPAGCEDPDPQVVATCLSPVGAIAVLPDGFSALVAERTTGRVLKVQRGSAPQLIATVPVDAAAGGLSGLVLSPSYAEDELVYAYAATADDERVLRIAPGEAPKPVLTGIPRGPGGALGVDTATGSLLVATGDPDGAAGNPASLAGKVLRIDTLGRPTAGNPAGTAVYASGLSNPQGMCTGTDGTTWVTDRAAGRDVLFRLGAGTLGTPAWSWPNRPGVAGCSVLGGALAIALTGTKSLFVLRPGQDGTFTGDPRTLLPDAYGRLAAAAAGPDGLLWLGTVNKDGAAGALPKLSDDRVIRIQPPTGGGASAA